MKTMKQIAVAVILLFTMSGCSYLSTISPTRVISYAIDSTVLVSSLLQMNDTVTDARASVNANKEQFTIDEWYQLELAGDQIDNLKSRFALLFGDGVGIKTRILSGVQLKSIVGDVFDAYDGVEAIVLLHAGQFNNDQRLQVLKAKATMDNLKQSYANIKATSKLDTDNNQTIDATATIQQALIAVQKIAAVFTK